MRLRFLRQTLSEFTQVTARFVDHLVETRGQVGGVKDQKLLNVLKEGDCFGEMAYLSGDRARRSASIISVSEVQLLKIQSTHLESLSEGCQLRFNREFLRTLIERLTWTSSVLAQFRR